jgi:hypothetical protein
MIAAELLLPQWHGSPAEFMAIDTTLDSHQLYLTAGLAEKGAGMPNDLMKLAPHVELARATLTQTAEHERALVHALSDEMKRFDQQTLQSIRTLSAEHEARRAGILDELQALASSIGTFQPAREAPTAIPHRGTPDAPASRSDTSYHDELERSLRALRDGRSREPH